MLWAIETFGHRLIEILSESYGSLLEEGQALPFEVQLVLFKRVRPSSRRPGVTARKFDDSEAAGGGAALGLDLPSRAESYAPASATASRQDG